MNQEQREPSEEEVSEEELVEMLRHMRKRHALAKVYALSLCALQFVLAFAFGIVAGIVAGKV